MSATTDTTYIATLAAEVPELPFGGAMTEKEGPIAPVSPDDESQSDDSGGSESDTEMGEPITPPAAPDDESTSDDGSDSDTDMEVVEDEGDEGGLSDEEERLLAILTLKQGKGKEKAKKHLSAQKLIAKKKVRDEEKARTDGNNKDVLESIRANALEAGLAEVEKLDALGRYKEGEKAVRMDAIRKLVSELRWKRGKGSGTRAPGTPPRKTTKKTADEWAAESQKKIDACPDDMSDTAHALIKLRPDEAPSRHATWIKLVGERLARVESMEDALREVSASLETATAEKEKQCLRIMQRKLTENLQ